MANRGHAVIWIDHHQARILGLGADDESLLVMRPKHPVKHLHHRANAIGSGHAAEDPDFFRHVGVAISGFDRVLIAGPANAKTEFLKYLKTHNPVLSERVAGVETLDHPSDGELRAHARTFFTAADRMI